MVNINPANIDWNHRCIKVHCKGNKEGYALFGERTEMLLKQWLQEYPPVEKLFNLNERGVSAMIDRLELKTGMKFSAHTFRRTFAKTLLQT